MKKVLSVFLLFAVFTSCISTKSTIRNIDDSIPGPGLNGKYDSFIITKNATDKKYGYDEDYPINVGFTSLEDGTRNQVRFLNALAGPNGEKIKFELKDSCCPFPTKKTEMGAGMIDIYEITWEGQAKPILLYINKFEKGELMIPLGFTARK
ncbi:2-dehydro-3-deoxyphosphooctonate aldolase [Flavobacterium humi]|uniref:2-dehydro-3-deoxyphosphooctonate aldolase n=1 Tax=Flavobacterium humi TaxID=2562683 RepID=A0A4Z0L9R9_9FLAO|nr:2-dehydro-3-deoxyphosphooctonate aldolase [Flavobacterium humi]TGD59049.1 2-dehydro-3-deoxyphosphooctonate aldolase [Flavobacterium humi]